MFSSSYISKLDYMFHFNRILFAALLKKIITAPNSYYLMKGKQNLEWFIVSFNNFFFVLRLADLTTIVILFTITVRCSSLLFKKN